ncbi:MAG: hypothetical protein WAT39_18220 [Planctomycetota bacterium]
MPSAAVPRRCFAIAALCLAAFALPAPTQGPVRSAGPDPYTRGDAALVRRAGYASLGPFPFGCQHGTGDIERLLGDEPIAWLETAHFRIGCALAPLELRGERDWVEGTRKELAELKRRLPAVKADTRDLEPWLRTHLVALRCEAIYAEVSRHLGVTDATFPPAPGHDPREPAKYFGLGPHLGMPEKFAVLVVGKGSSLARYAKQYMGGRETTEPIRHYEQGSAMVFAIAEDSTDGLMRNDHALHSQLAYNLAFQLYNGYRGYAHELPAWLSLGLAHWHARRISPRFPAYERRLGGEREASDFWKWNERSAGLLRTGAFEALLALLERQDATAFGMEQHLQAWSFVDWAMTQRPKALATFVHEYKAPFHGGRRKPLPADFDERAAASWRLAFGADVGAVEAQWRAHVLRGKK